MTGIRTEGGSGDRRDEGRHIYRMTQELLSIGEDYWIEDEKGRKLSMWMARYFACVTR